MGMCSICYIKILQGTIKLTQFMKLIFSARTCLVQSLHSYGENHPPVK